MIKRIGNPLYQWELNRQILIDNVDYDEINWWNKNMEKAIVTYPSDEIIIPNLLLQKAENIYISVKKNGSVVEHTSFGVRRHPQPEGYVYTETEILTYTQIDSRITKLEDKVGSYTWYIDTDTVVNKLDEECGTLADCLTDDFIGAWFYTVTTTSDKGISAYPDVYPIDGANGYINLRDYIIYTGSRLVHIPVFEAKASTDKDVTTGLYNWTSGVDGLMSSTDKAYLSDFIKRFDAANNAGTKNSGYDCMESGMYNNIVSGRPVSVIDMKTPVGNLIAVKDFANKVTSQMFIGEVSEKEGHLHSDVWFKSNSENAQWLRFLTSDNFIRAINTNYDGWTNWAVAPGIYIMKPLSDDGDRAFTEEHVMFVIPGSPEPDADYLAVAQTEDRVKMREHAITQIAVNNTGAMKVRYCPIPNLNCSVSNKCIGWFDLLSGRTA